MRIDVGSSLDDLRRKASSVRPSPRQVAWQRQELTAFVHFGPNTFTDLEWGTGLDDPAVFDPSSLDCSQWVRTLVSAGFKSVILTAKHHDGFCLWPSRYLRHTVAASPYRGDVVASLASACQEHGLGLSLLSVAGRSVPGEGRRRVLRQRQPGRVVGDPVAGGGRGPATVPVRRG
jgi:alpha-L-fucosidase